MGTKYDMLLLLLAAGASIGEYRLTAEDIEYCLGDIQRHHTWRTREACRLEEVAGTTEYWMSSLSPGYISSRMFLECHGDGGVVIFNQCTCMS